jgi:hypothetical protein
MPPQTAVATCSEGGHISQHLPKYAWALRSVPQGEATATSSTCSRKAGSSAPGSGALIRKSACMQMALGVQNRRHWALGSRWVGREQVEPLQVHGAVGGQLLGCRRVQHAALQQRRNRRAICGKELGRARQRLAHA